MTPTSITQRVADRRGQISGIVIVMAILCLGIGAQVPVLDESLDARFAAVDVFVDSREAHLAAYQFELLADAAIQIVGVEGGDGPAFSSPPYYDPAALMHERIVIAAYNTGSDVALPSGRSRIARVHLRISGGLAPSYIVKLHVASDQDGRQIDATAAFEIIATQGDGQ